MVVQPEILAPAGSPESLIAAVEHGADAVYLGLKQFNARGNAVNFSAEELAHYVPLAHARGTKVYLTLNTIVKMNEMAPILRTLADAADCGVDGVILQDIGLGREIARHFPMLRRHASTQMAIHNLDGVRFCVDEGFERVVLARELTLTEIQEIRQAFPSDVIELEVFCHGAMCYTYSGMCFFSGSVGGRSGNRGECAYTCRKGYRIHNTTEFPMAAAPGSFDNYLFSMKDMNTLDILPGLMATGVDSLKIEGRRKGPAYVGASVTAYRERMAETDTAPRERDLQLAFGRSYTQAFFGRGQFGDAPIDVTATGSQGLLIGEIEPGGGFRLREDGPQQYDGLRIVTPERAETLISFRDFQVDRGDRARPRKGTRITLKQTFPVGSLVYWVRSQDVDRRYQVDKSLFQHGLGAVSPAVDVVVEVTDDALDVCMRNAYAEVRGQVSLAPSTSGKPLKVRDTLFRFGDVPFREGDYRGPETVDAFAPMSQLKKLRRSLLAELAEVTGPQRATRIEAIVEESTRPAAVAPQPAEERFIARVDRPELLASVLNADWDVDFVLRPTLSTPDWRRTLELLPQLKGSMRLVLPLVLRRWDTRVLRRRFEDLRDRCGDVVLSNPGHFAMAREYLADWTLHADFSVYHLSLWAWRRLQELGVTGRFTLSLEDDRPNMEALLSQTDPARFEVIAYTDTPLFIAEACSLAALYGGCPGAKVCKHETLEIENEHGDRFQVRHDRCRSTVIGEKALSWSGHLDWFRRRGVRHFRADFTTRPYDAEDVVRIMEAVSSDVPLGSTHTENLDRILL